MHHEAQVVLQEILRQAGIERPVLLGLILLAPHVFVENLWVSSIEEAREAYGDLPQRLARHRAHVESLFWGWNNIWLDPNFRAWNIESFLDPIRFAVLVLQGAQDQYGTIKQVEAIQRRIPSTSAILLDDYRHAPHRDQRDATLSAISLFFGSLPSIAQSMTVTDGEASPFRKWDDLADLWNISAVVPVEFDKASSVITDIMQGFNSHLGLTRYRLACAKGFLVRGCIPLQSHSQEYR